MQFWEFSIPFDCVWLNLSESKRYTERPWDFGTKWISVAQKQSILRLYEKPCKTVKLQCIFEVLSQKVIKIRVAFRKTTKSVWALGKFKTVRTFDISQDETSWVTRDKSQNDLICIRFLLCQKRLTVLIIITSGPTREDVSNLRLG